VATQTESNTAGEVEGTGRAEAEQTPSSVLTFS